MKMNEFVEKIREEMCRRTGKEVITAEYVKNNGLKLQGLTIKGETGVLEPLLYLNPFYEGYKESGDFKGTMEDIMACYEKGLVPERPAMDWFRDYGGCVEGKLIYRLVNYELNREMLQDVVYERYLDLAKIYCVRCDIGEEKGAIVIHKSHLDLWKTTEEEIKEAAEKNTPALMPVKYGRMESFLRMVLDDMMTEEEKESGSMEVWGEPVKTDSEKELGMPGMYVLTNEKMVQGAAVMCYPGVLEKVAEKLNADLLILPSSVHEVLVMPLSKGEKGQEEALELKDMVYGINRHVVPWEDVLSDNAYVYRRETGETEII